MNYPSFFNLPQPVMQECAELVLAAQASFNTLVLAFVAENIALGITSSGKTALIADACQQVLYYGSAGSLWEALKALDQIKVTPEMAPYLTQARINWMKNQILQAISEL